MDLTTAAKEMYAFEGQLEAHLKSSKDEEARLRKLISDRRKTLQFSASGIDEAKVDLARSIIYVRGMYAKGGDDRASVIADAVKHFATRTPIRPVYGDLWTQYFGTKNYDGWHGQRSDHQYGYGPRHGSIIFAIGVNDSVRKTRGISDFTDDEVEAVIYLLNNIERVQSSELAAQAA